MSTISTLTIKIGADLSEASANIQKAGRQIQSAGQSIRTAGAGLTAGITAPLVAAGAAAFKFSSDFNSGMANVASLIPGNTERVKELKDGVLDLSVQMGKSAGDLTEGLYNVVSAFGDTSDSVAILETNARAATAGLATTTDAINLTSAVTKGYGDTSAEAVQHASDLALMTVRLGQTTFPELASSIGKVTPLAAELDVAQEELFGTMATFTGVTGGAAEVSTQLRGVFKALMAPTADTAKLFEELGVESGRALIEQEGLQGAIEALVKAAEDSGKPLKNFIGSVEGQTIALAATGGQADAYTEKLEQMQGAAGATDEAYREQTEGINKQGHAWEKLKAQISTNLIQLGDQLAPTLTTVMGHITALAGKLSGVIGWFGSLPAPVQTVVIVLTAMLAALGPVLLVIGQLIVAVGAITSALPVMGAVLAALTSPIAIIVAAIAGLVAIGITLWKNWDTIKAKAVALSESGGIIGTMVGLVIGHFTRMFEIMGKVKDAAGAVTGWFRDMFMEVVGGSIVPDMISGVGREFSTLDSVMAGAAERASAKTNAAFKSIIDPKALRAMDFNVTMDAEQLYAAVIEQGDLAAETFGRMAMKAEATAAVVGRLNSDTWPAAISQGRALTRQHEEMEAAEYALQRQQELLAIASGQATVETRTLSDAQRLATMQVGEMGDVSVNIVKPNFEALAAAADNARAASNESSGVMGRAAGHVGGAFDVLKGGALDLMSKFSPMGLLMEVVNEVLKELQPALDAIAPIVTILAKAIASGLMPILKVLFPVFKMLGVAITFVGEIFFRVAQGIAFALGNLIKGIGKVIDKIPGVSGRGLINTGEGLLESSREFGDAAREMKEARAEIRELEWPEEAAEAAEKQKEATDRTTERIEGITPAVQTVGAQVVESASVLGTYLAEIRDATVSMAEGFTRLFEGSMGVVTQPAAASVGGAPAASGGAGVTVNFTGDLNFHGVTDVEDGADRLTRRVQRNLSDDLSREQRIGLGSGSG